MGSDTFLLFFKIIFYFCISVLQRAPSATGDFSASPSKQKSLRWRRLMLSKCHCIHLLASWERDDNLIIHRISPQESVSCMHLAVNGTGVYVYVSPPAPHTCLSPPLRRTMRRGSPAWKLQSGPFRVWSRRKFVRQVAAWGEIQKGGNLMLWVSTL